MRRSIDWQSADNGRKRGASCRGGNMRKTATAIAGAATLMLLATAPSHAAPAAKSANATRPGAFWTEPSTLISLGFEWRIDGDENHNARVEVSYRKKGERDWHPALPLLRLQHEYVGGAP